MFESLLSTVDDTSAAAETDFDAETMEPEMEVWNRHQLATVSPCFG